jgi:hypothetical protein
MGMLKRVNVLLMFETLGKNVEALLPKSTAHLAREVCRALRLSFLDERVDLRADRVCGN